jgi:hypothetical protein
MGFLDNSGDIILDAVLTDTGRFRLAKGDGSFKISKFALCDDEIDYSLYNKDHANGSAYYDLEILQSPVMEAFTNNGSMMKSKLMSISRTNLLYLPIMKINTKPNPAKQASPVVATDESMYLIAVDSDTEGSTDGLNAAGTDGVQAGESLSNSESYIRVDQGLDTSEIPPTFTIDSDLTETAYIIEIDNRLGRIAAPTGTSLADPSYIDDDNIASYYLTTNDTSYVTPNSKTDLIAESNEVITGPRGTKLMFKIQASLELNTSTYLFDLIGGVGTVTHKRSNTDGTTTNVSFTNYIDTNIRVTGATTGYSIDIPVRFLKVS